MPDCRNYYPGLLCVPFLNIQTNDLLVSPIQSFLHVFSLVQFMVKLYFGIKPVKILSQHLIRVNQKLIVLLKEIKIDDKDGYIFQEASTDFPPTNRTINNKL